MAENALLVQKNVPEFLETAEGTNAFDKMFCTDCGLIFGMCKPCFDRKMAAMTPMQRIQYAQRKAEWMARK